MEDTHTVQQIEDLMYLLVQKIRDARTKEERKVLYKELKCYEKQWNNINDKKNNGKKYPEQRLYHSGPEPMNKTEVLKLIDSVDVPAGTENWNTYEDLSGVSVGSNRFTFIEYKMREPKHPFKQ